MEGKVREGRSHHSHDRGHNMGSRRLTPFEVMCSDIKAALRHQIVLTCLPVSEI